MKLLCRYIRCPTDLAKDLWPIWMYHQNPYFLTKKPSWVAETLKLNHRNQHPLTSQHQGTILACKSFQDAVSFKWMVWPWSRNKQLNTQSKPHFLYYFVYDSYIYIYIYTHVHTWLVVSTRLKNMSSSVGIRIPNWMAKRKSGVNPRTRYRVLYKVVPPRL